MSLVGRPRGLRRALGPPPAGRPERPPQRGALPHKIRQSNMRRISETTYLVGRPRGLRRTLGPPLAGGVFLS
jgi:hypothetical protein